MRFREYELCMKGNRWSIKLNIGADLHYCNNNKLDQEPTPERNRGAFEEPKRFGRGRTSERSSNW